VGVATGVGGAGSANTVPIHSGLAMHVAAFRALDAEAQY